MTHNTLILVLTAWTLIGPFVVPDALIGPDASRRRFIWGVFFCGPLTWASLIYAALHPRK